MKLETERLILRRWVDEDAEDLFAYASDPQIGPSAGWPAHRSVEESRRCIRTILSKRAHAYALCLKADGRAIGAIELKMGEHTQLTQKDDEAELGFWIGRPFWGQGFVPEAARALLRFAFETLGIAQIFCVYDEGNTKSQRVQEKLGFTYHRTDKDVKVPVLGEVRTKQVNVMTKAQWGVLSAPPTLRIGKTVN